MWNLASRKRQEEESSLARSWSNRQLLRLLTVLVEDPTLVPPTHVRPRQYIMGQYDIEPAIIKGQDSDCTVKTQRGSRVARSDSGHMTWCSGLYQAHCSLSI